MTGEVTLFDDGTFRARIRHTIDEDEHKLIRYERTTGEIVYLHVRDARWETTTFTDGETLHEPAYDVVDSEVCEVVSPPYPRGLA
ncbi:hypothetical protein BV210_18395 (plasmid) [Halorientalis sp. IM1011]|uniref:hypothetical protein n=1 Tax=Halorientalis sp. IM1011 TaxID=1932360 RepID=UPI00097CD181|nr:hypothetical protein [Halorientalis sp. IM1011]AQL44722.1 hypothetical protein BV210_18395 [Halorientalis sp. IM1011]